MIIINKYFNNDDFWFFLRAGLTLYASHKFGEYSQKQSCLFPSCPLVYFWSSWYPCSPERKKHIHVYYTSTNISTHRINHMHYCRAFINFPMARILLPTNISSYFRHQEMDCRANWILLKLLIHKNYISVMVEECSQTKAWGDVDDKDSELSSFCCQSGLCLCFLAGRLRFTSTISPRSAT